MHAQLAGAGSGNGRRRALLIEARGEENERLCKRGVMLSAYAAEGYL